MMIEDPNIGRFVEDDPRAAFRLVASFDDKPSEVDMAGARVAECSCGANAANMDPAKRRRLAAMEIEEIAEPMPGEPPADANAPGSNEELTLVVEMQAAQIDELMARVDALEGKGLDAEFAQVAAAAVPLPA